MSEEINKAESILERLSYHKFERSDLTTDECLELLKRQFERVAPRTVRQMVMQILELQQKLILLEARATIEDE